VAGTRACVARVAEFIKRVGGLGPANAKVEDTVTEKKLRALWRETVLWNKHVL
jgi:hypothetical protein